MSEQENGDQPSRDWLKMQNVVGRDYLSVEAPGRISRRRRILAIALGLALVVILATALFAWKPFS